MDIDLGEESSSNKTESEINTDTEGESNETHNENRKRDVDVQSSHKSTGSTWQHNKKRYPQIKGQTNHTYDDEYKKLLSFKKRATVSKSNCSKKANVLSARSSYKKPISEENFLAMTTVSVKGNTQATELEPSFDDTQYASINNVADLATIPSTDLLICTDKQFLAHLNEKQNLFSESLKLRLRFLAAKNQDPKSDPECQNISDELEWATSTQDMFKQTMSSSEDSNSCVQLGKKSNDSKDKKDLSKLQLTGDMPHNSVSVRIIGSVLLPSRSRYETFRFV